MMTLADDGVIGFEVRAPISVWNKKLDVDYPNVFKAIAKAAVAYASGNAAGAVNAAIDAFSSLRVQDTPPVLAGHLIRLALARAMAELTVEVLKSLDRDPDDPAGMVARLDSALDQAAIQIDRDFFARPGELPIVEAVQAPFGEWLAVLGLNAARVDSVRRRLPAYLTFALHREWAADPSRYAPIESGLSKIDTPFAQVDARERAWLRNTAYLRRLVQEPVFEETFGLDRIYVDLRAYWIERTEHRGGSLPAPPASPGPRDEKRYVVDLKTHLREWLNQRDKDDCIRVVCGGPGSGKTSFAKMFASELSATTDFGVLYIPLHEFDFVGDFRTALHRYIVEDARILPHDPLDDEEETRRLVVFFDGLDELAMEGKAGQEAAAEFCDHLDRRIGNVNRDGCRLKVILGGREIVVQANDRVFRRPGQILHVLPYYVPKREAAGRRDMPFREDFDDPKALLKADDRILWWTKYGEVTGRGYTELPTPLRSGASDEISAQPLFNYLLALSFERKKLPFGEGFNQNRLYRDLLEAVWGRRWGKRQLPDVEKLEFEEFESILKEIGLAAWHAGTRGVIANTVAELSKRAGLNREMKAFEKGAEEGALSLMAAFYFKQTKRSGERAYEFTHKTFGEYLAACRFVDAIAEIEQDRADKRQRRRPWDEEAALVEWIRLTGQAAIGSDLLSFILRQVEVVKEDSGVEIVARWQQTLIELLSYELHQGLPMHLLGLPNYQEMTWQARNAEEALLGALNCCAFVTQTASKIAWPDDFALSGLLGRVDHRRSERVARYCLGWLDATTEERKHDLYQAEFIYAHLQASNLSRSHLTRANLAGANLVDANLSWGHLEGAHFFASNLSNTNLNGAFLTEATLEKTNLEGAILKGAHLEGANLEGANVTDTDLADATLEGVDLTRIRNLDRARNLHRVKSWHGATIERKWIPHLERLGLDAEELKMEVVPDSEN